MDSLLKLLDKNARLSDAQLAAMLGRSEEEVAEQLAALEKSGVIRAYKALIDWVENGKPPEDVAIKTNDGETIKVAPYPDKAYRGADGVWRRK